MKYILLKTDTVKVRTYHTHISLFNLMICVAMAPFEFWELLRPQHRDARDDTSRSADESAKDSICHMVSDRPRYRIRFFKQSLRCTWPQVSHSFISLPLIRVYSLLFQTKAHPSNFNRQRIPIQWRPRLGI